MRLSKAELKILEQLAKGNDGLAGIAEALNRDRSQIYRTVQRLGQKDFLTLKEGMILAVNSTHVSLLLQLLARFPAVIQPLSDSGIAVFCASLVPKTVKEIARATGIRPSMVYHKLQSAKSMSFIAIVDGEYALNDAIWPEAKAFLEEAMRYEAASDRRAPPGAIIYFKNEREIVFSSEKEVDAALTAFSAFERFGIKLLVPYPFYYLPKKELSRQEVLRHALAVTEKEKTVSNLMYVALFYIRYKPKLKKIKHDFLNKIGSVLAGQKVARYPTLDEMKEKAEIYDIEL